jgi:uncharacterized protein (DUF2141 family)
MSRRVITGTAGALLCAGALAVQAAELRVAIENTDGGEGHVYVAVFNSAGDFLKADRAFEKAMVRAEAPVVVFPALPVGDYAISVFHDRNGNGKMDANLVGLPTERYGFSNDASAMMGPPAYEAARFSVKSDTRIVIRLR